IRVGADIAWETGSIMPDFETAEGRRVGQRRFAVFLNMSTQFALKNGFQESTNLSLIASGLKFDPSITEIAHGTGHIEARRDLLYRPTEADALDIAFVKDLNTCPHATEDCVDLAQAATA